MLEFYGAFPGKYHNWLHLFLSGHDVLSIDNIVSVPPATLTGGFNTYGVYINSDVTRFYFNRVEVFSHVTPPEYSQAMYILANLALGGGWPVRLQAPAIMDIAYIRVYREDVQEAPLRRSSSQP